MSKKAEKTAFAKEYSWVPGSRFRNLDANVIGRELDRLLTKHEQKLTADLMVVEARDPGSPLHGVFGFDDDAGMAREHRLEIARRLLRSVRVKITTPSRNEVIVRMTVATPQPEETDKKSYSTTEYAMADPEMRAEVLRQALRDLIAFRRKYAELSELAVVFAAIDELRKSA